MSRDIESNFVEESTNEERQCRYCSSCEITGNNAFCKELNVGVPEIGYCDFFQSVD